MDVSDVVLLLIGGFSSLGTYLLHTQFNWSEIRASSLMGVLGGLLASAPVEWSTVVIHEHIGYVVFGASFIGMVSSKLLSNYFLLVLTGMLFVIIFLEINSLILGMGGGLGATAFITLVMVLAVTYGTKKLGAFNRLVARKNKQIRLRRK